MDSIHRSRFELIEFNDGIKKQTRKAVNKNNIQEYIADILIDKNNNYFAFKNNIKYAWAKFIQSSKILNESICIFFSNVNLASI